MSQQTPKAEKSSFVCKMNFPVPYLVANDIAQLLNPNTAKDHLFLSWFENFFGFKHCCFTKEVLDRLTEINRQEFFMSIVPVGTHKLAVLVDALEDSCRCYCLGLFSASIALSGLAAESLTQMFWEMASLRIKGESIDITREKEIFGRQFSDPALSQHRRLRILKGLKIVTLEQFDSMDFVRDKRNSAVHYDRKCIPEEMKHNALQSFQKVMSLFKEITKIEIEDGKVKSINSYFLTK